MTDSHDFSLPILLRYLSDHQVQMAEDILRENPNQKSQWIGTAENWSYFLERKDGIFEQKIFYNGKLVKTM